jgi:hypothetical protein
MDIKISGDGVSSVEARLLAGATVFLYNLTDDQARQVRALAQRIGAVEETDNFPGPALIFRPPAQ